MKFLPRAHCTRTACQNALGCWGVGPARASRAFDKYTARGCSAPRHHADSRAAYKRLRDIGSEIYTRSIYAHPADARAKRPARCSSYRCALRARVGARGTAPVALIKKLIARGSNLLRVIGLRRLRINCRCEVYVWCAPSVWFFVSELGDTVSSCG